MLPVAGIPDAQLQYFFVHKYSTSAKMQMLKKLGKNSFDKD
jgi:hypothetical protein